MKDGGLGPIRYIAASSGGSVGIVYKGNRARIGIRLYAPVLYGPRRARKLYSGNRDNNSPIGAPPFDVEGVGS
jgi:hypothetical protein